MKKLLSLPLITFLSFSIMSCNSNNSNENKASNDESLSSLLSEDISKESSSDVTEITIKPGYVKYELKEPLKRKTEGLGAQFDTCILDKYNNQITDFEVIKNAVKMSNLQAVRIRFYPEMYERRNDNNDPSFFDYNSENVDFNSIEMNYLYKLLDLFEQEHVNVDLSWYGCRTTFESEDGKIKGSWMGGNFGDEGINGWMVAPSSKYVNNPEDEYAESVAACLNYLINEKKYTCLYEYSIFPEPEGVIQSLDMYKNIALKIKQNLKKYNIENKIKFSGPADYGNSPTNLENKYLSLGVNYDKVDSSVYCFHGDTNIRGEKVTPSSNKDMYEFAKNHVEVCDKYNVSWGVAECGTSNFLTPVTNSDTEIYDRAITMTRFFINLTNAGCTNIKYFIFADCSYDGTVNQEGLFRFDKSYYADSKISYQAKPIWYAWSLLMRYSDIGSEIYPITDNYENMDNDLCAVALHLPDNSWTYAIANIGNEAKKIAIVNEFSKDIKMMKQFRLTGSSIPYDEEATLKLLDPDDNIDASGNVAHVKVPANGIIILSNKE